MNYSASLWLAGFATILLIMLFIIVIIAHNNDGRRRDLFMSYCTAHGDKYEVCAKAWEDGEMK